MVQGVRSGLHHGSAHPSVDERANGTDSMGVALGASRQNVAADMTKASTASAKRSRAIAGKPSALRLVPPSPWRELARGWFVRPADDGDLWVCHGLRVSLFEACRIGVSARPQHCACCQRPLKCRELAYREADPREEPVSWREVRICGRCVDDSPPGAKVT